jgi:hypothetical protein
MKDRPQLVIRPHNKKVYLEMMREMLKKRNGVFTFVLRVSGGNIVDLVVMDNKTFKERG